MSHFDTNSKIIVIGTSGSGKSTIAKKLSKQFSLKDIELDALYWGPNWTACPLPEFSSKIENAKKNTKGWVIHGNYNKVRNFTWQDATDVIWLDYPKWLVMYRVIKRSILRILKNESLWSENKETFYKTFMTKDSIILWSWNTYHKRKTDYEKFYSESSQIKWHRINKTKDLELLLKD
jgi:adenylate kinase family enzyme